MEFIQKVKVAEGVYVSFLKFSSDISLGGGDSALAYFQIHCLVVVQSLASFERA